MPLAIGAGRVGEGFRVNIASAIAADPADGRNALRERVIGAIVTVIVAGEPRAPRRGLERGPGTDQKYGRDRRNSAQRPHGTPPRETLRARFAREPQWAVWRLSPSSSGSSSATTSSRMAARTRSRGV